MPNSFVIRDALFRGIGKARAAGLVGREALLDAALRELDAWSNANGVTIDVDESRIALEAKAGGERSEIWAESVPVREDLPEGLEALVSFAIARYGTTTMWWMDRARLVASPRESWPSVVRALRENGGPDPRPFWLAEAIERSAAF
jgi:hypothetical protein